MSISSIDKALKEENDNLRRKLNSIEQKHYQEMKQLKLLNDKIRDEPSLKDIENFNPDIEFDFVS